MRPATLAHGPTVVHLRSCHQPLTTHWMSRSTSRTDPRAITPPRRRRARTCCGMVQLSDIDRGLAMGATAGMGRCGTRDWAPVPRVVTPVRVGGPGEIF